MGDGKEHIDAVTSGISIPEAPGIGVELCDDAEERYPVKERGSVSAFRYADGSVKDW